MAPPPAAVAHFVGQARAGDPVAATARAMRDRLAWEGWPGTLVSAWPPQSTSSSQEPAELDDDLSVVVHTVDGGADLHPLLHQLVGRRVTLLHHGSAPGSNRAVLRSLRASAGLALAASPPSREELRALGFAAVGSIGGDALATTFHHAFDQVTADDATTRHLGGHPGPLVLAIGPLAAGQGLELLLDAFAQVITRRHPAAVLSLCGSVGRWYDAQLDRWVARRGLSSCEIISPSNEGEVLARLDRAAVLVAGRPATLDPYRWRAAEAGVPIVTGPTAGPSGSAALAAALGDALDRAADPSSGSEPDNAPGDSSRPINEPVLARALGLA